MSGAAARTGELEEKENNNTKKGRKWVVKMATESTK